MYKKRVQKVKNVFFEYFSALFWYFFAFVNE